MTAIRDNDEHGEPAPTTYDGAVAMAEHMLGHAIKRSDKTKAKRFLTDVERKRLL